MLYQYISVVHRYVMYDKLEDMNTKFSNFIDGLFSGVTKNNVRRITNDIYKITESGEFNKAKNEFRRTYPGVTKCKKIVAVTTNLKMC